MTLGSWKKPLAYGLAIALGLRIVLTAIHGLLWLALPQDSLRQLMWKAASNPVIPPVTTELELITLGAWRRWDAIHYLNLTVNGYRLSDAGATVYAPATSLLFSAAGRIIPGPLDLAIAITQVLLFGVVLTLVWQICRAYYRDDRLAPYAMLVCALLPLSYVFLAPTSESLFLALTLAFFLSFSQRRALIGGLFGFLAALTRSQGVLLFLVAIALLYEQCDRAVPWRQQLWSITRRGWPAILIPLGYVVFVVFRTGAGFPSLNEVYLNYSYVFFADPLSGIAYNIRWILGNLTAALTNIDIMSMFVYAILIVLMLRSPRHRKPALLVYTLATLLVIFSKINYEYGTDRLYYTQSFARYALVLWPVHIFVADRIRAFKPRWRQASFILLVSLALLFGTVNFLYLAPP